MPGAVEDRPRVIPLSGSRVSAAVPVVARVPTSGRRVPRARSDLFRSTGALLLGHGLRVGVQGAFFVLLARALGPATFGAYAAISAVAAMMLPLTGLGSVSVMVRDVARDPDTARRSWAGAVWMSLLTGSVLVPLGTLGVEVLGLAEVSVVTVVVLLLADTIGMRTIEATGFLWQALGRSLPLAILPNVVHVLRLVVLLLLLHVDWNATLDGFAWAYAAATVVPAIIAALATARAVRGMKGAPVGSATARLRSGLPFAVSAGAGTVTASADKALMAAFLSSGAVGVYAAAYRAIDMAYAPVRALTAAAYPLYLRRGQRGVEAAAAVALRTGPVVLAYGAVVGGLLAGFAPQVSQLLGEGYVGTEPLIRGLAVLLVLRGLGATCADVLTGADRNTLRMVLYVLAAFLNVGLNLLLLPTWGVQAAVAVAVLTELLLTSAVLCALAVLVRAERAAMRGAPTQIQEA